MDGWISNNWINILRLVTSYHFKSILFLQGSKRPIIFPGYPVIHFVIFLISNILFIPCYLSFCIKVLSLSPYATANP